MPSSREGASYLIPGAGMHAVRSIHAAALAAGFLGDRKRSAGDAHLSHHVCLAGEQDAAGSHVVMCLDPEVGQLTSGPKETREDDQADRVAYQQPDASAAGRAIQPPRAELPQRQQEDYACRYPKNDG